MQHSAAAGVVASSFAARLAETRRNEPDPEAELVFTLAPPILQIATISIGRPLGMGYGPPISMIRGATVSNVSNEVDTIIHQRRQPFLCVVMQ